MSRSIAVHSYVDTRGRNLCDRCNRWAGSKPHRIAFEHPELDVLRPVTRTFTRLELVEALDSVLPRMALIPYGLELNPDFDITDYYERIAAELIPGPVLP